MPRMSYEGYTQNLCQHGHYFEEPENYGSGEPELCDICKGPPVWTNPVDDTNCDSYGEIQMSEFLLKPAVLKECDLKHLHEVEPSIYRIPTARETKAARCYRPGYGGTPLVKISARS